MIAVMNRLLLAEVRPVHPVNGCGLKSWIGLLTEIMRRARTARAINIRSKVKYHDGNPLSSSARRAPCPVPEDAQLDRVPNPHPDTDYLARFTVPEFTSLCPVTGQPDFAILVIDYVPGPWLVESKSLKLYMHSFRNHGAFHEDCTVAIGKRLADLLEPRYLRIGGYWYPRGGIPIDVFWQTGELPKNLWLPDQGVAPYRAR